MSVILSVILNFVVKLSIQYLEALSYVFSENTVVILTLAVLSQYTGITD